MALLHADVEHLAHSAAQSPRSLEEADDRSSSLSDIDRHEEPDNMEIADGGMSDAYDTEAETERLENTPRKPRNVILAPANGSYQNHASLSLEPDTADADTHEPVENEKNLHSPASSPQKRKRSSFERQNSSDGEISEGPFPKVAKFSRSHSIEDSLDHSIAPAADEDQQAMDRISPILTNDQDSRKAEPFPKQKYKKGKRKGKKPRDEESLNTGDVAPGPALLDPSGENADAVSSSVEGQEIEDVGDGDGDGDGPEADNAAKTAEGQIKKKIAMDSLSAIEKCFATLRDKLFDERLSQYNEEIVMLEQPMPIHPELLAMKEVIDQRRNQKLEYEQSLLRLKLETLQRESTASKAQVHSQYMQTVRELRDKALDQLNKEYYQIQRERRSCEEDVPDYMYTFANKRSQQITQQRAYNDEVSVLSGVAKYVGFPSAPEISKSRPKDIDDDLRAMGISTRPPHILQQIHPATIRANLSANAAFPRQNIVADDQFLEQNPWANPSHPAHQQQRQLHRQISALSRVASRSSTPMAQGRVIDLTQLQGSASTIAEPHSGHNSSLAPTPAAGEQASKYPNMAQNSILADKAVDATPSRSMGALLDATPVNQTGGSTSSKPEPQLSPSIVKNLARDSKTPSALPKPLPFMQSGSSSRASPPVRHPVIKAEDAGPASRRSPIAQQSHGPAPLSTAAGGQPKRFAA